MMGIAGLSGFMNVSLIILLIGFTVLIFMVHFELGPLGSLSTGRRLGMMVVLGSGMVAFSIKLLVITVLLNYPQQTIAAHLHKGEPEVMPIQPQYAVYERSPAASKPYVWQALPEVAPSPAWNPSTPEKVALGERLFHDPNLSADRTVSCSSCHKVWQGAGVDGRRTSLGISGQYGARNAPTVWNAAFQSVLFWDGRAASLEEQAKGPPLNPKEMGMPSLDAVVQRVQEDGGYDGLFAKAFGSAVPINIEQVVAAIAAYERTLISPDSAYDRFVRGDESALSAAQLRGMELFQSIGCIQCHSGPNFSGASVFGSVPIPQRLFPVFDSQRYVAKYRLTADVGANARGSRQGIWRIPSLRNVALTAPYFHNGSVDTLEEAVRIMATLQRGRQIGDAQRAVSWSKQDKTLSRTGAEPLREHEVLDIVAFLRALSSDALVAQVGQH